ARGAKAGMGNLPRPSTAVSRCRPRDVQAAVRAPRRQPPHQGPADGARRDHDAESRLRRARSGRGAHDRRRRAGALGDRLRRGGVARSREPRCRGVARSSARVPRRSDIEKILILGSGPIVIGQAAEFDYSGVQACKVLREEGFSVVLVNSNPATIMTDPEFADATYIEPLLPGPVARVIERERPQALLATLGGQTALNLSKALHDDGTLERFGVELIGANYEAIARAEDRELFAARMASVGLRTPKSAIATSVAQARGALSRIGLPCIVR